MNQQEAISVIESLLPEIKKEGAAEGVLLKYAKEKNLAPAQLEKVAHVFNTAKTLTYFDQHKGGRGGTFPLVQPQDLVSEYTKHNKSAGEMQKAASHTQALDVNSFPGPSVYEAPEVVEEDIVTWRKAASELQVLDKQVDELEERYYEAENAIRKIAKEMAFSLRTEGGPSREEVYGDIVYTFGRDTGALVIKQAFDPDYEIPEDLDVEKRAFDAEFRADEDRMEFLKQATDLWEQMLELNSVGKSATSVAEATLEKQASPTDLLTPAEIVKERRKAQQAALRSHTRQEVLEQLAGPTPPPELPVEDWGTSTPGTGTTDVPELNVLVEDVQTGAQGLSALLGKASDKTKPLAGVRGAAGLADKLKGSHKGTQMAIDKDFTETQTSTVLSRLMQSDPIISEADPEMVVELFNTLKEVNPEFVNNPSRMRMLLREAIQYEAVPTHTISELADIRKSMAQARKDEAGEDERKYKI